MFVYKKRDVKVESVWIVCVRACVKSIQCVLFLVILDSFEVCKHICMWVQYNKNLRTVN